MSGNAAETQWYIARDGKQHGPLTDTEMRLFVQGGHLKAADLIWNPGLPDWRPAPVVFPTLNEADDGQPGADPGKSLTGMISSGDSSMPLGTSPSPTGDGSSGGLGQDETVTPTAASGATNSPKPVLKIGAVAAAAVVAGIVGWTVLDGSGGAPTITSDADLKVVTAPETTKTPAIAAVDPDLSASKPQNTKTAGTPEDRKTRIDADLQNSPMWRLLKQDYPQWYTQRIKDIVRMNDDKKEKSEVATHVVTELVALRRKHAEQALAANTDRLVAIAQTFLDNLKQLASVDETVCYSFISQGETSPSVIALNPEKGYSETVEKQIVAIFEAISDGRRSPQTRLRAQKPDYDRLAEQLGRLGWSQADLQLFADPGALGKAPPERVCKMVQDWFAAHIAVGDKATKDRLLFETLRPVIAG